MTEKKQKPKQAPKKQVRAKKYTLKELVEQCDAKASIIALELSRAGLLKQYEYELQTNEAIKPTLTKNEFNKIIKGE